MSTSPSWSASSFGVLELPGADMLIYLTIASDGKLSESVFARKFDVTLGGRRIK